VATRQFFSALLATVVWFLCLPLLVYLWFAAVLLSANVVFAQRWTEAGWWKPFGYSVVLVLEILLAAGLLGLDTFLCIRLKRALERQHADLKTLR